MGLMGVMVVAACGGGTAPGPAVPVPVIGNQTNTCEDAAVGLEEFTKGVRSPESSVHGEMRRRCAEDHWPGAAVACFAKMTEDDLGRCAKQLDDHARARLFEVLGAARTDRAAIAVARARLEGLSVGVDACDRFVAAVASVLTCEQMPVEARAQLGNETVEFWDLPTHGLPEDAQRRMATACEASRTQLEQQARDAGCVL